MRHKDGFKVLVYYQKKVLQEYDAVANSEAPATNTVDNVLHAGDYTARRSQFYVMPNKAGLDRLLGIKFSLTQQFDFQGANLLHITLRSNGTASKVKSQLIWRHKAQDANKPDTESWFVWRLSMQKKGHQEGSEHAADDLSVVITIERGVSYPRWDDDEDKALEAFERIPGEINIVEILCRPFESRSSNERSLGASTPDKKSKTPKSIRASPAKRGVKRKRVETAKKAGGNASASLTEGEGSLQGQDKQPTFHTSDDEFSKTASLPDAINPTLQTSPSHGETQASYFTAPEQPVTPTIMPTTPTADSTSQQTKQSSRVALRALRSQKTPQWNFRPIKREEPGVIDLTERPDEEEEIHHQIMDKELEVEQKRLEREEIQARRELNALHRTRLRLGRTP